MRLLLPFALMLLAMPIFAQQSTLQLDKEATPTSENLTTFAATVVDFTNPATATYTTNATTRPAQKNEGGVMVMWGGDVDGDGIVSYNGGSNPGNADLRSTILSNSGNPFSSQTFTYTEYSLYDMVLDGVISYNGGSNPGNAWLRSQVLTHPGNGFGSQTFTFEEQLP